MLPGNCERPTKRIIVILLEFLYEIIYKVIFFFQILIELIQRTKYNVSKIFRKLFLVRPLSLKFEPLYRNSYLQLDLRLALKYQKCFSLIICCPDFQRNQFFQFWFNNYAKLSIKIIKCFVFLRGKLCSVRCWLL